ncbi:expressed unknown protein [Seminavis robusta]|uniref:Uncharacterized protein n=1 Tax=Seminavis robusta TaxID=568900 RepID=A0A9N8EYA0_9STRA|nr:expressed unknown protein [Seminavis robusta]|eukprot:Sro2453_g328171.1  (131) ;mRNA; r:8021-8513
MHESKNLFAINQSMTMMCPGSVHSEISDYNEGLDSGVKPPRWPARGGVMFSFPPTDLRDFFFCFFRLQNISMDHSCIDPQTRVPHLCWSLCRHDLHGISFHNHASHHVTQLIRDAARQGCICDYYSRVLN